jgi:hypothetical protein
VCSLPQWGHLTVVSLRLLILKEAASTLIPAGTPSPDSAHLIITRLSCFGVSKWSDTPHLDPFVAEANGKNEEKLRLV